MGNEVPFVLLCVIKAGGTEMEGACLCCLHILILLSVFTEMKLLVIYMEARGVF